MPRYIDVTRGITRSEPKFYVDESDYLSLKVELEQYRALGTPEQIKEIQRQIESGELERVVRCKDCDSFMRYRGKSTGECGDSVVDENGYCSWGILRTERQTHSQPETEPNGAASGTGQQEPEDMALTEKKAELNAKYKRLLEYDPYGERREKE